MKIRASELKRRSKEVLSGNYGMAVSGTLTMGFVIMAVYFILIFLLLAFGLTIGLSSNWDMNLLGFGLGLGIIVFLCVTLIGLITFYLQAGLTRMLLNMSNKQPFSYRDMGYAFTHKPLKFLGIFAISFGVGLLLSIPYDVVNFVSMVTGHLTVMVVLRVVTYLFPLVGAIIFQLYFSQVVIILVENPEEKVFHCFRESVWLMDGNKGRLVYLWLSFIGMFLLGIGSFGIGLLWVVPYATETYVQFYLDIRSKFASLMHTSQDEETSYLNGVPYQ